MKVPSRTRGKLPRMAGRPFLTVAVAASLLAGCGTESSAAALKAKVRYEKGGGFAGVSQRLTVRPDGTGVAADGQDRRTFRLTAGRRRAVERAVRAADLAHTESPKERRG